MGVMGAFAGYGVFLLARKLGASRLVGAFLAGLIADWATYIGTSLALSSALHGGTNFLGMFVAIIIAFMPTQLFLGILEGFVTSGAYSFIINRRPGLLMSFTQGE
jgi:cobalt/nickel transport system permease protein